MYECELELRFLSRSPCALSVVWLRPEPLPVRRVGAARRAAGEASVEAPPLVVAGLVVVAALEDQPWVLERQPVAALQRASPDGLQRQGGLGGAQFDIG